MNKILPIILVVVLSGCAHYDTKYYGGVKPPYTPNSHAGERMIGNPTQSSDEQLTEGQRIGKSIDDKNKRLKALENKVQCMENKKRMESMGMKVLMGCY